jgi:hypothetical protein
MAKQIQLTQGQFAIVDDEDFDRLNQHKWYAAWRESTKSFYAVRNERQPDGRQLQIQMHRQILGLEKGDCRQGDHRESGLTLDNRRNNLRVATKLQNSRNRKLNANNIARFKGVSWNESAKSFQVRICVDGAMVYLGYRADKTEAARIYDRAAIQLHGEFARLNFPREDYV